MKNILIFLMGLLLLFSGCGKNEETKSDVEFQGIVYRAVWDESYQFNNVIRFESKNQWEEFLRNHPPQSLEDEIGEEKFDEEFFEENELLIYILSESSGSTQISAEDIKVSENVLELVIVRNESEIGTADMAARICIFQVSKDDLSGISTFEVDIQNN